MHILMVSYSKWSITFNVSYQQMVDAAFISDATVCLSIRIQCWEQEPQYSLGIRAKFCSCFLGEKNEYIEINSRAANTHVFKNCLVLSD